MSDNNNACNLDDTNTNTNSYIVPKNNMNENTKKNPLLMLQQTCNNIGLDMEPINRPVQTQVKSVSVTPKSPAHLPQSNTPTNLPTNTVPPYDIGLKQFKVSKAKRSLSPSFMEFDMQPKNKLQKLAMKEQLRQTKDFNSKKAYMESQKALLHQKQQNQLKSASQPQQQMPSMPSPYFSSDPYYSIRSMSETQKYYDRMAASLYHQNPSAAAIISAYANLAATTALPSSPTPSTSPTTLSTNDHHFNHQPHNLSSIPSPTSSESSNNSSISPIALHQHQQHRHGSECTSPYCNQCYKQKATISQQTQSDTTCSVLNFNDCKPNAKHRQPLQCCWLVENIKCGKIFSTINELRHHVNAHTMDMFDQHLSQTTGQQMVKTKKAEKPGKMTASKSYGTLNDQRYQPYNNTKYKISTSMPPPVALAPLSNDPVVLHQYNHLMQQYSSGQYMSPSGETTAPLYAYAHTTKPTGLSYQQYNSAQSMMNQQQQHHATYTNPLYNPSTAPPLYDSI